MRVTRELIEIFGKAWNERDDQGTHGVAGVRREAGLQAVLDHLFPEPGTNPLAECAPDRDTVAVRRLRNVLMQADQSEFALRKRHPQEILQDPEHQEILTAVASVRRLLTPWATRGWESQNAGL